jgi:acetylornithine deacetylase/succinyl-diaminopimelate desuccinylase-like protein
VHGFNDSRFFWSIGIPTYGLMPVLLPRAAHGKIHCVDERIPVDGIGELTRIVYKLIEGWNRR